MIIQEEDYLAHIGRSKADGAPVGSGRYPLGSGDSPYQSYKDFQSRKAQLKRQGLSEKEIADYFGVPMRELRKETTIAKAYIDQQDYIEAVKLLGEGWSKSAIGKKQGRTGKSVADLLAREGDRKAKAIDNAAEMLKESIDSKGGFIDVGPGSELYIGVSRGKLDAALKQLKEEGYTVSAVSIRQVFGKGNTNITVLAPPNTTKGTIYNNADQIRLPIDIHVDSEGNKVPLRPIENVSSDRIMINYAETGGKQKDGVIELRRGVPDLDLGQAHYAQVRIGVDGTHYLKGMAVYADDLPDGVDIRFNTGKSESVPKMEVLKKMSDPSNLTNPFGASIKAGGQYGALNIVNEEGDWREWSRTLSSQFLSKQSGTLAKKQLKLTGDIAEAELKEIKEITNPTIKRYYLEQFADGCDSDAVQLKAAALPRQSSKVILPIPELKENEIYAPTYKDGEQVALVRYPHGGTFEIPLLTVNNKGRGGRIAQDLIGDAQDAVGIHPKAAERLSGADFDGDTVGVIPTSTAKIKTSPQLKGLKDFDPKVAYDGTNMNPKDRMKKTAVQQKMGEVTNLITDMTIQGANEEDLAKAVRHSMVIIDAEKHGLDWKASERDNEIRALKMKYQGVNEKGQPNGASTIVSKAKKRTYINERREKAVSKLTPEERERWEKGEVIWEETGKLTYSGKPVKTKTKLMKVTDDASELSSGTAMEQYYVDYANRMKALGNEARAEMRRTPLSEWNRSAKNVYPDEVASLENKLRIALMNAPRERRAQALANSTIAVELEDHPEYDDSKKKKVKSRHLENARAITGANKKPIVIDDKEWEAIQAGAISSSKLKTILENSDADSLRKRAMPKGTLMNSAKISKAKMLLDRGYQWSEVASMMGVSVTTLQRAVDPKDKS